MGLPEWIGGERNWDYRYTWLRDAAFALYALISIGFDDEAKNFMGWLKDRCYDDADGLLQPLYGIDGRSKIDETVLSHLSGYKNSRPVRLGNAAHTQVQLDLYGAVLDAAYLYNKRGAPLDYDLWLNLRKILDWLSENWHRQDEGIWEVRGGKKHFVSSKLMCWVALERATRISRQRGLPGGNGRWIQARDNIYEDIMAKGWNPEKQSFTQTYGGDALDASLLLMPLVKFVGPTDPRWLMTLDSIEEELVFDTLVNRYNVNEAAPDGLEGGEGSFSMCSFWLVECLTQAGRLEDARLASKRCSPTPTTSASTLKRSAPPERRWATSPRHSPTSPSSAPPSTWTGPSVPTEAVPGKTGRRGDRENAGGRRRLLGWLARSTSLAGSGSWWWGLRARPLPRRGPRQDLARVLRDDPHLRSRRVPSRWRREHGRQPRRPERDGGPGRSDWG
jgi:hypothetical protein